MQTNNVAWKTEILIPVCEVQIDTTDFRKIKFTQRSMFPTSRHCSPYNILDYSA